MTRPLIALTVLLTLNCLPAWATSASKSYKIFVNLPASVSIPLKDTESPTTQLSKTAPREVTEKIITTAGNKKILLRTFVAK